MFDPYRKWLGIPPKDQPPHHYRLLGLELYEDDLDVIEGAADRAMGFVRQYQSGEHAALAAKLLNEIATARLCLLKPKSKDEYDASLKRQLTRATPAVESAPPAVDEVPQFVADAEVTELVKSAKPLPKRKKKATNSSHAKFLAAVSVGPIALILLVVLTWTGSNQVKKPDPSKNEVAKSASEPSPTDGPISSATKSDAAETPSKLTEPADSSPTASPSTAAPSPSVTSPDTAGNVRADEPTTTPQANGPQVNLLDGIDLKRDIVAGEWTREGSSLVSGGVRSRIYLPTGLPDDYQLQFKIKRLAGRDTLFLGFVMAGRLGMLAIDGYGSTLSGLYVDERDPNDNCTTRKGALFNDGQLASIVLTVHASHLHASFDGQTILDWYGSPDRLFVRSDEGVTNRGTAFLATVATRYLIESATMTPILAETHEPRVERLSKSTDLMPLLKADRDGKRGHWRLTDGVLHSPDTGHSQLCLPISVPREYTLSGTIELPAGSNTDPAIVFGLIAEDAYLTLVIKNDGCLGIERIDDLRWDRNESSLNGPFLTPGTPLKLATTVTHDSIRLDLNGRTVLHWTGSFRRLSTQSDWAPVDGRKLYIGAMSHFKIDRLELGPPLDPPALPAQTRFKVGRSVDLLSLIDPKRDALEGAWELAGKSLRVAGTEGRHSMLVIPTEVPAEYKLTMRVTRETGGRLGNEALVLKLSTASSLADVVIDGQASTISSIAIDRLNPNDPRNQSIFRGLVLPVDQPQELVFTVRNTGIKITNGRNVVIDWSGNPSRLQQEAGWGTPAARIAIGSDQVRFRFDKLTLEPLEPSSFPDVPQLGADGDLLAIIDPSRDSRKAQWKKTGDGLASPLFPGYRLAIPVLPPDRYLLTADVERQKGDLQFCLGLVVDGHSCNVVLDGGNSQSGLELVDGQSFGGNLNPTRRQLPRLILPRGKRVKVRCLVLPDTVVVTCDDGEVIRWRGDPRRLSLEHYYLPPNYTDLDHSQLWLGGWDTEFLIRELNLKPLSDDDAKQIQNLFSSGNELATAINRIDSAWTPESDVPEHGDVVIFINSNSGRCLSVRDGAMIQGPFPTSAQSSEKWRIVTSENGFKLVNQRSGEVMAVSQGSKSAGAQLIQWKDLKSQDQRWQFVQVGKHYCIQSQLNGFAAGVAYASKDVNVGVVQWPLEKIPDQIWRIQRVSPKRKSKD